MGSVQAGQYRHRFTIQEKAVTRAGSGQPQEGWSKFAERWAKVSPVAGMEKWRAEQFSAEVTHEVTLRSHLPGVTSQMRGMFGGRVFEFDAVLNPEERNLQTVIHCIERPDQPDG